MTSVSICGVGRLGGALALGLNESLFQIDNLIVRNAAHPEVASDKQLGPKVIQWGKVGQIDSDIVVIATGDAAIGPAAEQIAELKGEPKVVLHTNGAFCSSILRGIFGDAAVGSMHPLISVRTPRSGAHHFRGSYFCIDGDDAARAAAEAIAGAVSANVFSMPADKRALYHASAVTACGHLVALVDVAIEMFVGCGFAPEQARQILLPLIQSTIDNLAAAAPAQALTGPFARGDVETFERHLEAIRKDASPEALQIYLKLALRSVELVLRENGADPHAETLEKAVSMAKQKVEC